MPLHQTNFFNLKLFFFNRKLVIFNPLGHSRRVVLTLMVDKPNVKVTNSSTTLTIPHQISPVWEKAGFIEDLYEVSYQ